MPIGMDNSTDSFRYLNFSEINQAFGRITELSPKIAIEALETIVRSLGSDSGDVWLEVAESESVLKALVEKAQKSRDLAWLEDLGIERFYIK